MKTTSKWVISILLILTVAVVLVWQIFKEFKVKSFVVDSIQTELNQYFEDSVQFKIEKISFQYLEKSLVLEDISVDLIRNVDGDTLASIKLAGMIFKWYKIEDLLNSEFFKIDQIDLVDVIALLPLDFTKIKTTKPKRASFDGKFEMAIDKFNLENGKIELYQINNKKRGRITGSYDLSVDSIYFKKGEIPEKLNDVIKDIELQFYDLTYFLPDTIHRLDIQSLAIGIFKREVLFTGVHYRPTYDEEEFSAIKKVQSNYIDFLADSIKISNIAWVADTISAAQISLQDIVLNVYKDKNYPLPDDRFVPILIDLLTQNAMSVDVRACLISGMDINYTEISELTQRKGFVNLSNIAGKISNITNRPDSIEKYGKYLEIEANTNFYGEGKLAALIQYHLTSKYGYFKVYGTLQPMEISTFNQYFSSAYPLEIASGRIQALDFQYTGGRESVTGEMNFKYTDLKIKFNNVINEEELGDKTLSWLANVVLSQENPRKNGKYRVGKIDFTRDVRKSMFSYWSNSLVSGFQSTVGFSKPARIEKVASETEDKGLWNKMGFGKNTKDD